MFVWGTLTPLALNTETWGKQLILFLGKSNNIKVIVDAEKQVCFIHPKSKNVCGFHFSVQNNLRKKCVNSHDKILRQKCVNYRNSIMFFKKKGQTIIYWQLRQCLGRSETKNMLCKTFQHILVFQDACWPFLTHCKIDSFCVLKQSFCGKLRFSADFSVQLIQFFGRMSRTTTNSSQTIDIS